MSLHDTIKNFYIKCLKPLLTIEVLGQDGEWNEINSVNVTAKQFFYKVTLESTSLLCTSEHILIDEYNNEVFAIDSLGKFIKTRRGIEKVLSVVKTRIFDNAYDISLKNGTSHLYFTNDVLSHNCIVIDEMAFIPKNIIDNFFASVLPVISSGKNSKAIIVSTPNGANGLYYDLWKEANENAKNGVLEGWQPFRIRWWETGGIRNEKWKQEQIAAIGETRWRQEYECEFLASASVNKLVPDDIREKFERKIAEYHAQGIDKGKQLNIVSETEEKVYKFTMWHEFQEDHTYLAAGDVAEGTGNDSSVLYIWDITHLDNIVQCAKFASPVVSTIEFAFVCNKILNLYHCPPFICESNGIGAGFLDSLRITYGYQNIVKEGKNGAYGIKSHVQIKGKATLWLNEMLTTKGFGWTIYDKELIQEMETFVRKDTKEHVIYQAMQGCHDDFIMTLVWTAWMLNPDIIQTYYIVAESFTSTLGKILPKTIMPIDEYTLGGISRATSDPLYKQFIDYKNEMLDKLHIAVDEEKKEETQFRRQFPDIYFGDDDGPSWNCPSSGRSAQSMFGQSAPAFYIN